jgi:hypothetical protein
MPKLHSYVKILFAILLLSFFTACSSQNAPEITQYTWEPNNLSINFPAAYHTVDFESLLVITQSENDLPLPGKKMMELILIKSDLTVDEAVESMNIYPYFTEEETTVGDIDVTRLNYSPAESEDIYTMLIVEAPDGKALEFVPGLGNEDFAEAVLATLTFDEVTEE